MAEENVTGHSFVATAPDAGLCQACWACIYRYAPDASWVMTNTGWFWSPSNQAKCPGPSAPAHVSS